jgi:hypothetical protein
MSPTLLDSQLATLELSDDLHVVDAVDGVEATAQYVVSSLLS